MAYQFPPDIRELVGEQMASGQYRSEDEVLRDALRALSEEAQDLAAVQVAVAEWKAGDEGMPLDQAFEAIRKKHGVS
ncbi:MAG: type II toxin-antitoxin system ParD family antitoxin [Planctomycetaceae bacterium]|nr:type II toxin-antitoxin system ParD family antitoxin [Planctomycetaceae bacterium]